MKTSYRIIFVPVLIAGFWVGVSVRQTRAEDVVISQFNDAGGLSGWRFDYGGVAHTIEFDGTQDAANSATSGSMKVTMGFDAVALAGNNKGAITIDLPSPLDASAFLTMEMDVRIDPSSTTDGSGNSGFFQMVVRNGPNYDFNSQFGATLTANDGWRHLKVTPLSGVVGSLRALTLELSGGGGGAGSLTGPVILNIDNVKFTKPAATIDIVVGQFNDVGGLAGWRFDYGGVTHVIEFDATQDAASNPASGAMKATLGFDAAALDGSGNNKGALTIDLPAALDGSAYLSMEMDVKVDPASAVDNGGGSGYFQMVIRNGPNYDFNSQFGDNLNILDEWRHIKVTPLSGAVNDIRAISLELYGGAGLTGPVILYVDNVKFTVAAQPPPPPSLRIDRPIRGLNLISTSGQYQRQNIATVGNSGYGWIGRADPFTYSVTIKNYPDAAHSGFQTHIFLVAGNGGGDSFPDYSQPNLIFLDIQNRADGTAAATFHYKINEAGGNAFLYGPGTLGNVANPTPLGTWSMTFNQDTNVTVTTPNGTSQTFILPPDAAALFAEPLAVFVGDQPNAGANVGQTAVLSRFQITNGDTVVLDDDFLVDEQLDSGIWKKQAGDANGVQLIGSEASLWLSWTTPDAGFSLQSTTDVGDLGSWTSPGWVVPQMGAVKRILIYPPVDVPDPTRTYEPDANLSSFRLFKPAQ